VKADVHLNCIKKT